MDQEDKYSGMQCKASRWSQLKHITQANSNRQPETRLKLSWQWGFHISPHRFYKLPDAKHHEKDSKLTTSKTYLCDEYLKELTAKGFQQQAAVALSLSPPPESGDEGNDGEEKQIKLNHNMVDTTEDSLGLTWAKEKNSIKTQIYLFNW